MLLYLYFILIDIKGVFTCSNLKCIKCEAIVTSDRPLDRSKVERLCPEQVDDVTPGYVVTCASNRCVTRLDLRFEVDRNSSVAKQTRIRVVKDCSRIQNLRVNIRIRAKCKYHFNGLYHSTNCSQNCKESHFCNNINIYATFIEPTKKYSLKPKCEVCKAVYSGNGVQLSNTCKGIHKECFGKCFYIIYLDLSSNIRVSRGCLSRDMVSLILDPLDSGYLERQGTWKYTFCKSKLFSCNSQRVMDNNLYTIIARMHDIRGELLKFKSMDIVDGIYTEKQLCLECTSRSKIHGQDCENGIASTMFSLVNCETKCVTYLAQGKTTLVRGCLNSKDFSEIRNKIKYYYPEKLVIDGCLDCVYTCNSSEIVCNNEIVLLKDDKYEFSSTRNEVEQDGEGQSFLEINYLKEKSIMDPKEIKSLYESTRDSENKKYMKIPISGEYLQMRIKNGNEFISKSEMLRCINHCETKTWEHMQPRKSEMRDFLNSGEENKKNEIERDIFEKQKHKIKSYSIKQYGKDKEPIDIVVQSNSLKLTDKVEKHTVMSSPKYSINSPIERFNGELIMRCIFKCKYFSRKRKKKQEKKALAEKIEKEKEEIIKKEKNIERKKRINEALNKNPIQNKRYQINIKKDLEPSSINKDLGLNENTITNKRYPSNIKKNLEMRRSSGFKTFRSDKRYWYNIYGKARTLARKSRILIPGPKAAFAIFVGGSILVCYLTCGTIISSITKSNEVTSEVQEQSDRIDKILDLVNNKSAIYTIRPTMPHIVENKGYVQQSIRNKDDYKTKVDDNYIVHDTYYPTKREEVDMKDKRNTLSDNKNKENKEPRDRWKGLQLLFGVVAIVVLIVSVRQYYSLNRQLNRKDKTRNYK